jgi:LCP family protein required for cell wall assembly
MMAKIDLLKYYKKRHRKKKIAAGLTTVFFLILGSLFLSFKLFYAPKEVNSKEGFFATLSHLILSPEKTFASSRNTVNILLLGIGGAGHEGPNLTDTILIASINKKTKKLAMYSIPRDLLVDTNRFGKQKINAVNALVEVSKPGAGGRYVMQVVSEVTGAQIDHYALIDFKAFEQIINAVGGLDINVPRTFSDPLFPRFDDETQTFAVTFQAGQQHMDGRAALIYARSRHGNNGEGNDFARSRRQQQIIVALKEKILSSDTYLSPAKVKGLFDALNQNISTDINPIEAISLAKLYKNLNIPLSDINTHVITNGPTGLLYADYYNSQYVLLPKKSDWSEIRALFAEPNNGEPAAPVAAQNSGTITLAILNGTEIPGLASSAAMTMNDFGYEVVATGNAPQRDFQKTVIYNLASDAKQSVLPQMRKVLDANATSDRPAWLDDALLQNKKPDFVIVVGAPKGE